jgi:hypothetical protein
MSKEFIITEDTSFIKLDGINFEIYKGVNNNPCILKNCNYVYLGHNESEQLTKELNLFNSKNNK